MDDYSLDRLLDLAGEILVIHPDGYWVKFIVKRVDVTPGRPHGIDYSLTSHQPDGERILGFDNDHPVPPASWDDPRDHEHRDKRSTQPNQYRNAEKLLADFWAAVDKALLERRIVAP